MDRLSILVNPASFISEPHIAGTTITTATIADCVWEGYSLDDINLMHQKLNSLAIFNACWFESTFGSQIWRIRWKEWNRFATPHLKSENIDNLALPPNKLQFLHSPYTLISEYALKVRNGWLGEYAV